MPFAETTVKFIEFVVKRILKVKFVLEQENIRLLSRDDTIMP